MLSRVNLHRFLSATDKTSVFRAKGLNKVWDTGFIASKNGTIGYGSISRSGQLGGEGDECLVSEPAKEGGRLLIRKRPPIAIVE